MKDGFFIWAHRGASANAPENTLAAFRAAERAGADGIELDVHLSRDGVPVVIHDDTLDRTTNGRGPVADKRWGEIRRLDAGKWFSKNFAGEHPPSLEEVLTLVSGRLRLNLEIKDPRAATAVLNLLTEFPRARVLVSSFDHRLLENLRREAPNLPLAFLVESPFWRRTFFRAVAYGAEALNPRHDRVSRTLLAACRERGLAVYPWTVDEPGVLVRMCRLEVDGVFTNDPEFVALKLGKLPVQLRKGGL
jgi:glycerophosphoryl diester phosphodiesterase